MTTSPSLTVNSTPSHASPLISIIVAVYNNAATLQRCIDSVASQSYPHKELVIIDGGSTDGTVEIIKQNSDKIAFWVSEQDKGIYNAFNKGIDRAKGEWIYFLGSDDYLWDAQVLGLVAENLIDNHSDDVKLMYGKVTLISPRGDILEVLNKPWDEIKNVFFLKGSPINHQGVFHHYSLFKIYGKFDESFSIAGDYDLMIRVLKNSIPVFLGNTIIAARQVGGISARPLSRLTSIKEDHKARIKSNIFQSKSYNFSTLISYALQTIIWNYAKAIITFVLLKVDIRLATYIADRYRIITGRDPTWTKSYYEYEGR
jgi:glycosyltransferase involved in cell wall biosynthesis